MEGHKYFIVTLRRDEFFLIMFDLLPSAYKLDYNDKAN